MDGSPIRLRNSLLFVRFRGWLYLAGALSALVYAFVNLNFAALLAFCLFALAFCSLGPQFKGMTQQNGEGIGLLTQDGMTVLESWAAMFWEALLRGMALVVHGLAQILLEGSIYAAVIGLIWLFHWLMR